MGLVWVPINKGLDKENVIQLGIVDFSVSHREEQYSVICRKKGGAGDQGTKWTNQSQENKYMFSLVCKLCILKYSNNR